MSLEKHPFPGPTQCGAILIDLNDRFASEKALLMSALRSSRGASAKSAITTSFCRLSRQHVVGNIDECFVTATAAVGLGERIQEYKSQR